MIEIEGHLTQLKLEDILKRLFQQDWLGNEIKVPNSRKRWDMAVRINSTTYVIEYDGDEHYRNSLKIKSDLEKDKIASNLKYKVVRFPYWVQLDSTIMKHYFGIEENVKAGIPHGFITTKIFPASFCEKGIERFKNELDSLPAKVRSDVVNSLNERSREHGIDFVLPQSLRSIIETHDSA